MKSKERTRNGIIIIAIILSSITIGLGLWQYKRLQWKEAMIASYEASQNINAKPVRYIKNMDDDYIKGLKEQRIIVRGHLPNGDLSDYIKYVGPRTIDDKSGPGYYVFVPFILNDGTVISVNIGWIKGIIEKDWPKYGYDENSFKNNTGDQYTIEAVPTNISMTKSRYTPDNKDKSKIWLYFDSDKFLSNFQQNNKEIQHSKIIKSMYLHVNHIINGAPIKGLIKNPYKRKFVNRHKEYMITWFSLAILLLLFAGFSLFGNGKRRDQ